MSRSHRKTPITGHTTSPSEKQDKQWASRATRKRNRQRLRQGMEPLDRRCVSDAYAMSKDGRSWRGNEWQTRKDYRK